MAERTAKSEKAAGYLDELRDLQSQYRELSDLHERQKVYAEQLSEIVRALQREADVTVPLRPEILSADCSAAYLVSDAVVVMFDIHREMTSKPLSRFPPNVVVAVIEECASELGRQLAKKREAENEKVETLERVLREISKAHSPYRTGLEQDQPELERVSRTERIDRLVTPPPMPANERREAPPVPERRSPPVERREAPPAAEKRSAPVPERKEPPSEKSTVEMAPSMKSSSSFAFKGNYGNSKEEEASY